jgi:glycosyltransferase involved in cell wall biosynthesis
MRILLLAPHPYYIVRGTPIDLDLVVRVLTSRPATTVDLVVYEEGEDRHYPGLTIHRAAQVGSGQSRPGFSMRKVFQDLSMLRCAYALAKQHDYDIVHAGEEAVYIAMILRKLRGIPYAYDLDSSLAEQMVEKMPVLGIVGGLLRAFETAAIRRAMITFPVCNSLADLCKERGAAKIVTLHDISQLAEPGRAQTGALKRELGIDRLVLLYVGNLEPYQGIDLLVESFARAAKRTEAIDLVIIGGNDDDIERYRGRVAALGVPDRVHFMGPRPYDSLDEYLAEADILTAPRIRGRNTPMKVFPYLHSGRPVLVTDLPTHSQILTNDVAMLAAPEPDAFADAIVALAECEPTRRLLGERGQAFAEANHTFRAHSERLNAAYDWIEERLGREPA